MIRMTAARRRSDHHARTQSAQHLHQLRARVVVIADARIGEAEILAHREPHHARCRLRLGRPQRRRAARAHLALREVENAHGVPGVHGTDEGAAAGQLGVIPVRSDGEEGEIGHAGK